MYLSYRHKPGYNGEAPRDKDGNLIEPIGYNKNVNNVFSTIENTVRIFKIAPARWSEKPRRKAQLSDDLWTMVYKTPPSFAQEKGFTLI